MIKIKHNFEEDKIDIYLDRYTSPDFIGTCNSCLSFTDLRVQIKNTKATGYHFYYKGDRFDIDADGRVCPNWPKGLYELGENMLWELLIP